MNQKHNLFFALSLFVTSIIATIYAGWFHGYSLVTWFFIGIGNGLVTSILGIIGYSLGTKLVGSKPARGKIIFNALFVYFLAHGVSDHDALFFIVLIGVISFLTGWRLSGDKKRDVSDDITIKNEI